MEYNKKVSPTVIELFLKRKKTQYFSCFHITILFQIALNYKTHFFIIKIPNKKQLQEIASNHSSVIGFKIL